MRLLEKVICKIGGEDKTAISGLTNMAFKPISMVLTILYTPLLLSFLGEEKYGLWATLLSIINWVNYFDVGIGNGLRNLLSRELSEEAYEEAKKSVSTAYIVLTCIAGALLLVLISATILLDWNVVFNTSIDMTWPLLISFSFICINFVLALAKTILYALQLSERVSLIAVLVQTLNLIGLLLLRKFTTGSLVTVSILYGMTSFVVNILNTISIARKREYLIPSIHSFSATKIREICSVGVKFLVIQIMALVLFTTDNMLISHYFGSASVTPFSIADKIFNTAYTVLAAFLVPYWSRSTVAFAQNDYAWLSKSVKKVCKVGLLFLAGFTLLRVLFTPLVELWLGYVPNFENGIPTLMYLFYIAYSVLGIVCQFINGSGKVNIQLALYCFAGVVNIPFSIFLGVKCGMGTFGIRLASFILVLIQCIGLTINLMHLMSKVKKESLKVDDKTRG